MSPCRAVEPHCHFCAASWIELNGALEVTTCVGDVRFTEIEYPERNVHVDVVFREGQTAFQVPTRVAHPATTLSADTGDQEGIRIVGRGIQHCRRGVLRLFEPPGGPLRERTWSAVRDLPFHLSLREAPVDAARGAACIARAAH